MKKNKEPNTRTMINLEYYARRGLISEMEFYRNNFYSTGSRKKMEDSYRECCDMVENATKMFGEEDRIIKVLEKDLKLMEAELGNGK